MFERALLNSSPRRKALPIAYVLATLLVGLLVLVPLIHTQALSTSGLWIERWILPPAPPGPARVPRSPEKSLARKPRVTARDILEAPPVIPHIIRETFEEPPPLEEPTVSVLGAVHAGIPGGSVEGVIGRILTGLEPSPAPPPEAARSTKPIPRIQIGGQVIAARAIWQPEPEYPPLARMSRIQGTVRLKAIISTDGRIQDLKVLSGHPLLVKAAIDAVSSWRYQPTLLNGEPVEVLTEIAVYFRLAD